MARTPFLPTRDGISPSLVWLPHGPWKTLGDYFAVRFPMVSAESWADRMSRGEVVDNSGVTLSLDSPFRTGACVFYYRQRRDETPIPFEEKILFLDGQLLVVDKPHFVAVTPGGRFLRETLLARLKRSTSIDTLTPIHRLDRETAGVMMFSVDPSTRSLWQSLFRYQKVNKIYEAVAPFRESMRFPQEIGSCIVRDDKFFRMREIEAEANAFTTIEMIERRDRLALYRLYPRTGKMHQLRVHMNSLGIPIQNDRFYPEAFPPSTDDFSAPLQLLARSLAFTDPLNGEHRLFESNFRLQISAD
ncbi:MAG: pseudouridine synthase [Oxalobacteraceae bacterium]|jgi:tRNA pseudouridine32 synthase/23S rRNA pseudouridine746 synthase|nr:pseudouridine synthase [Oxalobacteraceae bacterium]